MAEEGWRRKKKLKGEPTGTSAFRGGRGGGRFFSHGGTGSTAGGGENRFDLRDGGDWELRGCVGSLNWVCVDDGT
jgi:hypothetical protein